MSNITISITVPDPVEVLEQYDVIKVYRSNMGEAGDFVEVSTATTRILVLDDEQQYEFVDEHGDPAFYYKTSYYNTITQDESDLSDAVKGDLTGNYVSVQDLREEGFTEAVMSDARALALVQLWEDYVNQFTGQWFYPLATTLELDGTGSNLLQLSVPIIRVDELRLNDSSYVLPTSQYVAYTGRTPGNDDRTNPRIKIKSAASSAVESFYQAASTTMLRGVMFKRGEHNQKVTGLFGYVEADGTAPVLIKYAVRKLVSLNSAKLALGGATMLAGPMTKEVTDRHSVSYSEKMLPAATLSGDPEVDRIMARYRRPLVIMAPYGEVL